MNRKLVLIASLAGFFLSCCCAAGFVLLRSSEPVGPRTLGLTAVDWPRENRFSTEKAALGKLLFFDVRLSPDASVACSSCHSPMHAFAESSDVSMGFHGHRGVRNAPTLINVAYEENFFWDGRAETLEEQIREPAGNPIEMASSPEAIVSSIRGVPGYRAYFTRAYGTPEITWGRITQAIATFERTIVSGNSPYDRYRAGEKNALTAAQRRGLQVFREARCNVCHSAPFFTNGSFANLGIGAGKSHPDPGRFRLTHDEHDWGAFKTPTLREVALTAPYMHDGSLHTLEEVVDFYDGGGAPNRNLDNRIRPLHLAAEQKHDLVAFLHALSGEGWQNTAPERFPQ